MFEKVLNNVLNRAHTFYVCDGVTILEHLFYNQNIMFLKSLFEEDLKPQEKYRVGVFLNVYFAIKISCLYKKK